MSESTPATLHPALQSIKGKESLVVALFEGTEAMRRAGQKYLPKEPKENNTNYANRLARSVLYPAYRQTVQANTGKLFLSEVEVENSSPEMDTLLQQVDQDDNDITEFSKDLTESAIHQGCAYILVDFPNMEANATLADEIQVGGRPYWVHIQQSQVLEASPLIRNGKRILGVFRYKELVEERDGEFGVTFVEQIKQFQFSETGAVIYKVYRKDTSTKWELYDNGVLLGANKEPLTEIPIIDCNVNPVAFYVGQPSFYDLAEENQQHWQQISDYNNIVHHSQVPILVTKGVVKSYDENGQQNNEIVISPNTVIAIENPDSDIFWLEVNGNGAGVGSAAVAASEARMAAMSLQLLSNADANASATASQIDAVESLSRLSSIAKTVEQAINLAIVFTYKYLGVDKVDTTISLSVDDAVGMSDDLNINQTATIAEDEGNAEV